MLRIGKTLWKKKKKVGRHIPDIKTYYKVTVIKAMYYFFKVDGSMVQIWKSQNKSTQIQSIYFQQ